MRGLSAGMSALGLDFQEVAAQLQSWAASFLGTKQKLYDARRTIDGLISQAQSTGWVESGGKRFTLSELTELRNANDRFMNENIDLERKFLSALEELKQINEASAASGEIMVGIPGIAGVSGLDAVPVAAIAWATGAAVLIGSIAYFMSRVKKHLDRLAGATAGTILSAGTIALLIGGAYLLFGRK